MTNPSTTISFDASLDMTSKAQEAAINTFSDILAMQPRMFSIVFNSTTKLHELTFDADLDSEAFSRDDVAQLVDKATGAGCFMLKVRAEGPDGIFVALARGLHEFLNGPAVVSERVNDGLSEPNVIALFADGKRISKQEVIDELLGKFSLVADEKDMPLVQLAIRLNSQT